MSISVPEPEHCLSLSLSLRYCVDVPWETVINTNMMRQSPGPGPLFLAQLPG